MTRARLLDLLAWESTTEVHRALAEMYEMHYGFLTRNSGHFTAPQHWLPGAPVLWYIDERGESWPQVILPDGHILTHWDEDVRVTTHSRWLLRRQDLDSYAVANQDSVP